MSRPFQQNAGDPHQLRFAKRKAKETAMAFRLSLREVMQTPAGRRVLWELLTSAGVFRSVYSQSAQIHYNSGRQDFGLQLRQSMLDADDRAYGLMEQEARHREKRLDGEIAAMQQDTTEHEQTG